jgi:hypothetical protein
LPNHQKDDNIDNEEDGGRSRIDRQLKGEPMHHHRFSGQLLTADPTTDATPTVQGFVMCPLALQQGGLGTVCPWQQVYQLAYAQAQAVARPSLLERFQASNWN